MLRGLPRREVQSEAKVDAEARAASGGQAAVYAGEVAEAPGSPC